MVEGVNMLPGGLCAALLLGVFEVGVAGRGSTVLVLVLVLPSTCSLVSSVL
jgi:hypothetical protein